MGGSKVFQIVGYQNSGKTTLMEKLIKTGNERGLKVGSIKHHGHGGSLDHHMINKDSKRHQRSGSLVSTVAGEDTLLIEATNNEWKLEEIIGIYNGFDLDVILVEGYKYSTYPKVVLIKNEEDLSLLEHLTNIRAVVSWFPLESSYRIFSNTQLENFIDFFYESILTN